MLNIKQDTTEQGWKVQNKKPKSSRYLFYLKIFLSQVQLFLFCI